jgi:hypothetical protein
MATNSYPQSGQTSHPFFERFPQSGQVLKLSLASIFRAAVERVGGAGFSRPVALIVACGYDESPGVAPVGGLS